MRERPSQPTNYMAYNMPRALSLQLRQNMPCTFSTQLLATVAHL
jgi:hypothetical protein